MLTVIFSLIALFAGYHILTNWTKEQTYEPVPQKDNITTKEEYKLVKEEIVYKSHCWNCKSEISSKKNVKCNKCNKYFRCNTCHKCYCDYGTIKSNNKPNKSEWVLTSIKANYGHCNNCNKKLKGDISKPLCYECYSSSDKKKDSKIKFGYCQRCNKKLRGDLSKPFCFECYKKSK